MKISEPFFNPICLPVPIKEERSLPLNSKVKKFEYLNGDSSSFISYLDFLLHIQLFD